MKSLKGADLTFLETKTPSLCRTLPKGFSLCFSPFVKNMKNATFLSGLAVRKGGPEGCPLPGGQDSLTLGRRPRPTPSTGRECSSPGPSTHSACSHRGDRWMVWGSRPGKDDTHHEADQHGGPDLREQTGWRETQKSLTVLSRDGTGAHRAPWRDQAGSGSGRLPGGSGFF